MPCAHLRHSCSKCAAAHHQILHKALHFVYIFCPVASMSIIPSGSDFERGLKAALCGMHWLIVVHFFDFVLQFAVFLQGAGCYRELSGVRRRMRRATTGFCNAARCLRSGGGTRWRSARRRREEAGTTIGKSHVRMGIRHGGGRVGRSVHLSSRASACGGGWYRMSKTKKK